MFSWNRKLGKIKAIKWPLILLMAVMFLTSIFPGFWFGLYAKNNLREAVYFKPLPRILQPAEPADTLLIRYETVSLQIPWTDIQTDQSGLSIKLQFKQGQTFNLNKVLSTKQAWKQVYGDGVYEDLVKSLPSENFETEYAIQSYTLNLTPDDFSLLDTWNKSGAKLSILQIKPQLVLNASRIYSFETESIKGFQFQMTEENLSQYIFFHDNNDVSYFLVIGGPVRPDEIDFILSSIKGNN